MNLLGNPTLKRFINQTNSNLQLLFEETVKYLDPKTAQIYKMLISLSLDLVNGDGLIHLEVPSKGDGGSVKTLLNEQNYEKLIRAYIHPHCVTAREVDMYDKLLRYLKDYLKVSGDKSETNDLNIICNELGLLSDRISGIDIIKRKFEQRTALFSENSEAVFVIFVPLIFPVLSIALTLSIGLPLFVTVIITIGYIYFAYTNMQILQLNNKEIATLNQNIFTYFCATPLADQLNLTLPRVSNSGRALSE
jgi:hypothetical protein